MTSATKPHVPLPRLTLIGVLAAIAATIATTGAATIAQAAGVSLEVGTERIPLSAFAMWIIVGGVAGILLAWLLRRSRRFIVVTIVGTALFSGPPIARADAVPTKTFLVIAHLLAAAIIVPTLSHQLPVAPTRQATQDSQ
ncbi:DUF6069 family protein [Changpingibacter yushuensis]|uniref:DUF6069 family protein n=1 Tax=Changpingibacter yushuensis TaxID=2758440 RepID=UPI00165E120E|nr:DUF6069 family protein [Changpingibacter yushuensis]